MTDNLPTCIAKLALTSNNPLAMANKLAVEVDDSASADGFLFFEFNDHSVLGFHNNKPFTIRTTWDLRNGHWVMPEMDEIVTLDDNGFHFQSPTRQ